MKKVLFAALTAGVLSFSMAPAVDAAVRVGIGPGGVHVGVGPGWHGHPRWHHQHCKKVKVWRHGHARWVKKCWWH